MHDTGRSSGTGVKIAALAGIGIGLAFLLSSGSSKASGGGGAKTDPCKDLEDQAGPVIDKATKADIIKLGELMDIAKTLKCDDLVTKIAKKISELGAVAPTPKPKAGFNSNLAPSPVDAHIIAVNIGKTPALSSTPKEFVASDGTYVDLRSYAKYFDPLAVAAHLKNLQMNSGITADGIYGPQTEAAFNWFYWNSTRADGSSDTRTGSIAGDALCVTCGHEKGEAAIGSCCAACAKGQGGCGEQSAADQLANVVALRTMGGAFGGPYFGAKDFGSTPWGGVTVAGFGGGAGLPNRKPNVGGCSTGACGVAGEEDPSTRAANALDALRPKVGAELHPLVDAAIVVVKKNGLIDLSAVPVIPGDEQIRACLQTYNNERALAVS